MIEAEPSSVSRLSDPVPMNRRSEVRFACRLKVYHIEDEQKQLQDAETWLIGKTIDVSLHGIALTTRHKYVLGSILVILPLLPCWKREGELLARVTDLRQEAGQSWRVGCELIRPLTDDELVFFLGNAE